MTTRWLALALVPLLATAAHAQAPGEVVPTYYGPSETAPTYATPVVVVPAPPPIDPMAHRWSVGLALGGFGVATENASDGSEAEFRMAELALRLRATRRIEVFLAFSGGRQVLENDEDGDLATDLVTLGARIRFMPEQKWSWFLMAGFGSTLIASHTTPEDQRDELRRPHAMLGIGLERRWQRFGLEAEARAITVGVNEDQMNVLMDAPPRPGSAAYQAEELSGGQFTLGASVYF